MIITGFLGFLIIAPNGLHLVQQNNKNRNLHKSNFHKNNSIKKRSFLISKRSFSTKREINPTPIPISKIVTDFIIDKNINPVYIYENLEQASTKQKIVEDTRGLSGIYLILNKVTKDYYIGSASTNRFNARFSNHLINLTGSKVVKNAVRKYKISTFAFLILEIFPEVVNKENNKNLLDLEDFYLKSLLPNYNILTEAGSSFGYKHTEITRILMKAIYSEERRMVIGNLNKGKSLSSSTIELMRQGALNRIIPTYSEEAKENMKKKSKAIIVYNFDYTVHGEFSSIVNAAKCLGCDHKTIRRALQTPKKILRRR